MLDVTEEARREMAALHGDRIPYYFWIVPVLGLLGWAGIGKGGGLIAGLLLAALLIGSVLAAVHHAELVALRLGEPYGTLVLTLSMTIIEIAMLVSLMLTGQPNPFLVRDAVQAVVILVVHGIAGACIVIGALRRSRAGIQHRRGKRFSGSADADGSTGADTAESHAQHARALLFQSPAGLRRGRLPRAVSGFCVRADGAASRILPSCGRRPAARRRGIGAAGPHRRDRGNVAGPVADRRCLAGQIAGAVNRSRHRSDRRANQAGWRCRCRDRTNAGNRSGDRRSAERPPADQY